LPYIGGSQDNNLFNLIFGYNGFGRITGSETGSAASQWGATGWNRMFLPSFGGQISWLIPGALVLLFATVYVCRDHPRDDRTRAAALLWGGWLLVTGLLFSFAKDIIHRGPGSRDRRNSRHRCHNDVDKTQNPVRSWRARRGARCDNAVGLRPVGKGRLVDARVGPIVLATGLGLTAALMITPHELIVVPVPLELGPLLPPPLMK